MFTDSKENPHYGTFDFTKGMAPAFFKIFIVNPSSKAISSILEMQAPLLGVPFKKKKSLTEIGMPKSSYSEHFKGFYCLIVSHF